jgi:hypothetical protein
MTDKQRIAALRDALEKTITPRATMLLGNVRLVPRLAAINSTALRALRDDDHAEIAGGEQ